MLFVSYVHFWDICTKIRYIRNGWQSCSEWMSHTVLVQECPSHKYLHEHLTLWNSKPLQKKKKIDTHVVWLNYVHVYVSCWAWSLDSILYCDKSITAICGQFWWPKTCTIYGLHFSVLCSCCCEFPCQFQRWDWPIRSCHQKTWKSWHLFRATTFHF